MQQFICGCMHVYATCSECIRRVNWFVCSISLNSSQEVFDVVPDIITCAKGITSGYMPLGAVLFSDKLLSDIKKESALFFHGYTYSGHPACCAAALKNIEIIKRDKILQHVKEIEPYFHEKLKNLYELPIVGDVRDKGLMAGIECVINKDSNLNHQEVQIFLVYPLH